MAAGMVFGASIGATQEAAETLLENKFSSDQADQDDQQAVSDYAAEQYQLLQQQLQQAPQQQQQVQ